MICGAFAVAQFPRMPLPLLVGIAGLPFIAAGAFLALAFRARYQQSQVLYFWDLVGAALGILYVVPALEWLGGVGALVGASVFALTAAAFFFHRWVWTCPIVLATGLVVYSFQQRELIDLSALAEAADKPMFRALGAERHRGEVKDTRWSAYARTDLVDRTGDTGLNLYVDGGAGSYMFRFPGDYRQLFFVRREAAFFPYYFSPREHALIIGPGGGADVLYALMTGWRHIEAVEINPEIAALVRSYGEYNGHLYDLEGVELHIGDGRNYLERSRTHYDLIALPLVYAEAADLVGYALSENYLFTREAFAAYLDHLAEGGRLALVVHNHALMLRVVATLGALWEERGHEPSAVLDHLVVINGARGDPTRQEAHRPLLLVQQQPYTAGQLARLHAAMEELGLDAYFSPGRNERPALATLRGATLADFVAASALDISPTTDDRPFFYDATRGLDSKLTWLLIGASLACVLVLLVPLPSMRQRSASGPPPLLWALFAAGLGTGFMMVEIHLLQRFGLFLRLSDPDAGGRALWAVAGYGGREPCGRMVPSACTSTGVGVGRRGRRPRLLSLWILARRRARWGVGVVTTGAGGIDVGSRRAARNVVGDLLPGLSALGWFTTRRNRPLAVGRQWFLLSARFGRGRSVGHGVGSECIAGGRRGCIHSGGYGALFG